MSRSPSASADRDPRWGGAAEELRSALERIGGLELADVFMFPVPKDGQGGCHYPRTKEVRLRGKTALFYVRSARVPFDIVPLRPTDPGRDGIYYSLGEGLDGDGSRGGLLLVQAVGAAGVVAVREEAIAAAIGPLVEEPRTSFEFGVGAAEARHCLAAYAIGARGASVGAGR